MWGRRIVIIKRMTLTIVPDTNSNLLLLIHRDNTYEKMLVEHWHFVTEAQVLRLITQRLQDDKNSPCHRTSHIFQPLVFSWGKEEETTTSLSVAFEEITITFSCRYGQISTFRDILSPNSFPRVKVYFE